MVGTFNKLDYRLRPAKHAERVMLIDVFRRLRFAPLESYKYVGFGSVAFIDHRMVNRALGITKLTSIEATDDAEEQRRFRKNKPLRQLALRFGHSNKVLPTIDFTTPSIIWLDYDDALSRSMANDLAVIARTACSGTFVSVTFTVAFPTDKKEAEKQLARLKENFPEFLSDDAKALPFQNAAKHAEFGRKALGNLFDREISDADAGIADPEKRRAAFQVCFFRYSDGQPMVTLGWVIVSAEDLPKFQACDFDALPFVRTGDNAFVIRVPKVTPLEITEMEKKLPNLDATRSLDWIPERARRDFEKLHRYLPNFGVVEPV